MSYLLGFLLAAGLSTALIPLLVQWSERLGLVDQPGGRKVHPHPIARVGGIAIGVGVVAPTLVWVPLDRPILAYLTGALVLLGFGVVDDRWDLAYGWKFLGQILAVLVVVVGGGLMITHVPFCGAALMPGCDGDLWSPAVAVPVTLLALVGVTNAINLADGLDGLAGGTTLLIIGMTAIIASLGEDPRVALLAVIVVGAILGFLRYNTYPARVFMGDAGSQFLGFSAGVLALMATQVSNPAVSPALPLLLLALPIADTLAVIVQRMYEGRSPFSPDRNHVHHKLMALGLSHYEAVLVIYGVQAALVSAVYLLRHESDALVMGTFVLFGAGVVTLLHLAAVQGWRFGGGAGQGTWLDRALDRVRGLGLPAATGLWLLRFTLPVALVVGPLLVARVPPDVGLVAWVALGLALLGMRLGERAYLLSLGVYLDAALVAYVLETSSGLPESYWLSIDIFFTLMAVALGLLLRFSSFRSFRLNPLDFLLVFLALLVPPVLHRIDPEVAVGGFMLKFVVLCYAGEVLLSRTRADRTILASGVLAGTLLLGLRGLP